MALHNVPRYALTLLIGLTLLAAPPITLLLLTATLGCAILAAVLREPRPSGDHGVSASQRPLSNTRGAPLGA
ncbi:hypothetical protein [Nocardia anaemiae]|uniref:hypothetical protein n=1 Tax=Nocardia anaemiae TaxID=263910 RepID=UPI0007A4EE33|nr:hypothetical protein [Nocardia anaemiae]